MVEDSSIRDQSKTLGLILKLPAEVKIELASVSHDDAPFVPLPGFVPPLAILLIYLTSVCPTSSNEKADRLSQGSVVTASFDHDII